MKIVVCGLEHRGQQFIKDVQESAYEIEIIAVTDTFGKDRELQGYENISYIELTCLQNYEYDYIVITPRDDYQEIEGLLLKNGIRPEKIKSLDKFRDNVGKFYCNICESKIFAWKYIGEANEIFCKKNIAGGGRRRGGCVKCGSNDRGRFVYYVMENFTKLLKGSASSILHFAPEYAISEKLKTIYGNRYISADILRGRADEVADITKLKFENEKFDYIICNHVMEHIQEEQIAFSELKRCLQPDGILIFTTPICWQQKTYEDNQIITESERIRYYGQKDHVRLYGSDIVERIENFGFNVNLLRCDEIADETIIKKMGFPREDSVMICRKKSG